MRLGINIDHVATIRNARGSIHPDPLKAAKIAEKSGADGITAHLREDRRHISDQDIKTQFEPFTEQTSDFWVSEFVMDTTSLFHIELPDESIPFEKILPIIFLPMI